jgi:hypothetical protein
MDDNSKFIITRSELTQMIREIVKEELFLAIKSLNVLPTAESIKWVTTTDVIKELNVTRQTLTNWRKGKNTMYMMKACVQKVGSKVVFNLEALKEIMQKYPHHFGNGRDYAYRNKPDDYKQKKLDNKFFKLHWQLKEGKTIPQDQKAFYLKTCEAKKIDPLLAV